jgi:hypothetical protein
MMLSEVLSISPHPVVKKREVAFVCRKRRADAKTERHVHGRRWRAEAASLRSGMASCSEGSPIDSDLAARRRNNMVEASCEPCGSVGVENLRAASWWGRYWPLARSGKQPEMEACNTELIMKGMQVVFMLVEFVSNYKCGNPYRRTVILIQSQPKGRLPNLRLLPSIDLNGYRTKVTPVLVAASLLSQTPVLKPHEANHQSPRVCASRRVCVYTAAHPARPGLF